MNKLKCKKCGYEREINEFEDFECVLCGSELISTEEKIDEYQNETVGMDKVFDETIKIGLQHSLRDLGNKRVWQDIESIPNPIMRSKYRRVFFEIGGKQ